MVRTEGRRQVPRPVQHYSLDAILAVGFRVRSHRGTQFRKWANARLSEYGAGAVTSAPAGIDCGASCQASFAAGTQVTLTATPGQGATFTGWTGACTGTGACVVTAAGAAVVGATFEGGCMDECPAGGSECLSTTTQRTCGQFDADPCREWSPSTACTGVEECTLGRCGAEHQLSVLPLAEAAVGTVTSAPEGITCGLDGRQCQHTCADGAEVTLTATSDPEAVFAGWALVPLGDTTPWPASARWRRAR